MLNECEADEVVVFHNYFKNNLIHHFVVPLPQQGRLTGPYTTQRGKADSALYQIERPTLQAFVQ